MRFIVISLILNIAVISMAIAYCHDLRMQRADDRRTIELLRRRRTSIARRRGEVPVVDRPSGRRSTLD